MLVMGSDLGRRAWVRKMLHFHCSGSVVRTWMRWRQWVMGVDGCLSYMGQTTELDV